MNAPFFEGEVWPGRATFDAWADRPLLQSVEAGGLVWPSSCRNGTCRTCMGQLVAGRVRYSVDWPGLSAEEKAEGCVLPCVALPLSDVVLRPPGP
jgi:ferredoxin